MTDEINPNDSAQGDSLPDDPSPMADADPNDGTQLDADTSEQEKPRERRPLVFGKGAWIGVLLPYVVLLVVLQTGSWLESKRDSAHLKPRHDKLVEKCNKVDAYLEGLDSQSANDWREYLNWKEMSDSFRDADHEQTPELMTEAKKRLYGDRPGLNGPLFTELREEAESYIDYWSEYEAVIQGDKLPAGHENVAGEEKPVSEIPYDRWYPTYYTIAVGLSSLFALIGFRWYVKAPLNFSWLSVVLGVVGFFLWIGLHYLDKNVLHIGSNLAGGRAAFNPYRELAHDPTWLKQFMAIRFFGLVLLVPLVEEFFLRGWLMRYIDDPDWDEVPLGEAGTWALVGIPIYAAFSHPELLSAVVWFSMVTWLYIRTKSIWNCVITHMITNLLLGLYVIKYGVWELW